MEGIETIKSKLQSQEDSHQKAEIEENPVIDIIMQSEIRENPVCASRNANPPIVPGDPAKTFIRTTGCKNRGNCGGTATGCTAV